MHRSDAYLRGREAGNWTSARLVRSLWALAVLFLPALLARLSTTHADSALTDAIQKIDNVEDLGVSRSLEAAGERDPHRLHGLRRRQLVVSEFDIDSDAFSAQREARAPKKTTTKRKKTTTKKRATTRRKTKTSTTKSRTKTKTKSRTKTKSKTATRTKSATRSATKSVTKMTTSRTPSRSLTRTRTSTRKLSSTKGVVRATALRKSFPMGLVAPSGDPNYSQAIKLSKGMALYYRNAVQNLKKIVKAAVPVPAARKLAADTRTGWRKALEDPVNIAKVRAYLEAITGGSDSNSTSQKKLAKRAVDPLVLPYVHSINRQLDVSTLPLSYDLRLQTDFPRLTRVKDQGGCGANVAFSAMAALESTVLILSKGLLADGGIGDNNYPDFSEAHAYFCDWGQSCEGGYDLAGAAEKITQWGATYEECIPYTGARPASNGCAAFCHVNRGTFEVVPLGNSVEYIKYHIFTYGPVQTTFTVFQDFLDWSVGSACVDTVWKGTNLTDGPVGGHAVAIVGWEEDGTGNGFWIVRNSWGVDWCDSGYFRMAYGADGIAGLGDTQGFKWIPSDADCYGRGLVPCGEGACAESLDQCPVQPNVCPEGQARCAEDQSCVANATMCSTTCAAGQVRCWTGECASDYLSCAGQFPLRDDCNSNGLFTCFDGTCSKGKQYCPSCEAFGLVSCERGGTCALTTDDCPSCRSINLLECGDGSCAITSSHCPAVCEGNGQVTCPNLQCADMITECGTCESMGLATCHDGSCAQDSDHCPSCESVGKVACPSDAFTRICADSSDLCPSPSTGNCEDSGLVTCPDGTCASALEFCPQPTCGGDTPVNCGGGICAPTPEDCFNFDIPVEKFTCEQYKWVTCTDKTCAPSVDKCSTAANCSSFGMLTCGDGHCGFSQAECG